MVASPHHIELPNYPFIRTIFLLILLTKGFPSEQKKRKASQSSPARLNAKCHFNANSAQEISAFQRHPYNYPRRVSNALTAYTDGSKRHHRL